MLITDPVERSRLGFIALLFVCCLSSTARAETATATYSFGVVPQHSVTRTAENWLPLIEVLSKETGYRLVFHTAPTIPEFEDRLAAGDFDFAYMSPSQYVEMHEKSGYEALARARGREIQGILVVSEDSPIRDIHDLNGREVAFPSPSAFAASLLPRAYMQQQGIHITPIYVSSHDSVYLNVYRQRYLAGGGIVRTLNQMDDTVQDDLRVIWNSAPHTPHAIAVHPRVTETERDKVLQALLVISGRPNGIEALALINHKGYQSARDDDWDDIRALDLQLLE